MDRQFTSLRSLVRGFANAMNLVNPEVQEHHEKVAYLAYRLAEEMGYGVVDCRSAMYAALLHDVGSVVLGEEFTLDEVEQNFVPDYRAVSLDEAVLFSKFMAIIIDFRSPFTAIHSAGVTASAERLARLSGMSDDECKMMRIAGSLHDVGKLRVRKAILEKPGKLTTEEFNEMKEHAYYTYVLLKDIDGFEQICSWAAFHHEKMNGTGYPFKLSESQIPLGARIMAVADVFSAITEDRPYRAGMPKDKVLAIMREKAAAGDLSKPIVNLLIANFDAINEARDLEACEAGKRYFESIERNAEPDATDRA